MDELKKKLIDFGMSDKEASVYLAMLELGPASALDIAKKADVNRATTYILIESLKRRGLMNSVEREKKTLFAAESPEHLLSIVGEKLVEAEKQQTGLHDVMPEFMALFNAVEEKPRVRFFESYEGIRACREALLQTRDAQELIRVFIHYNEDMVRLAKFEEEQRLGLNRRASKFRLLYSMEPGLDLPAFGKNIEIRRAPHDMPLFHGELNIADRFILAASATPRPIVVIIESKQVAELFRSLFDLAWRSGEVGR